MKVAILDDYQDAVRQLPCFSLLNGLDVTVLNQTYKDPVELSQHLQGVEALVLIRERSRITEALLQRLPDLKVICQTSKGIAHVDADACTRHGVAISVGTPGSDAPAELCWALILAAMRNLPAEVQSLQSGGWQTTIGYGLAGKTLGILGYGAIAKLLVRYATAFRMQVLIWGRESTLANAAANGLTVADSKAQLFRESDVLTLQVRLVPETRGIVTAADLALMKPTAVLVNTARAPLIEPGALEQALAAGRPGRAAVDVYEDEPVVSHPLVAMPNAVCTPHLGYAEWDNYEAYLGEAFRNLLAFRDGAPNNIVNPEVLAAVRD